MRILYWSPLFPPEIGGIEIMAARLARAMQRRNHDVVVLASHGLLDLPDETNDDGVPVYRFRIATALKNKNLADVFRIRKRIARVVESFQADVVHLHFGGAAPIAFFYLKTRSVSPVPLLVTLHGSMEGLAAGPDTILGQVFRSADWVTACTGAMLEDARRLSPEISECSSVVYYGLPAPPFAAAPLSFDEPKILCLGRLVLEKGFDLAIAAFASILERHPKARLTIAGDGPVRPALEEQAAELGLSEVVQFTGSFSHEEVYRLIDQAAVVVMPSRYREGFGIVAVEAAQMARPVVATRAGGIPEAVIHEETGLLVGREDGPALADAIALLLDNPEIAARMGEAGRARALDLFSEQRYAHAYEELYRTLLREGKSVAEE